MENEAKIERIKTLMENFGVTQSEFAKRISIDASNFPRKRLYQKQEMGRKYTVWT